MMLFPRGSTFRCTSFDCNHCENSDPPKKMDASAKNHISAPAVPILWRVMLTSGCGEWISVFWRSLVQWIKNLCLKYVIAKHKDIPYAKASRTLDLLVSGVGQFLVFGRRLRTLWNCYRGWRSCRMSLGWGATLPSSCASLVAQTSVVRWEN